MKRTDAPRSQGQASPSHTSPGYASEDFKSFSEVMQELESLRRSGSWGRLVLAAGRRRSAIWHGVGTVRRLQRLELPLTAGPEGEAIRRSVKGRNARVARAVLQLPDDRAQYLRGRSRQALRTNLRHAEGLGITCRRLPDDAGAHSAALDELLHQLGGTGADREFLERTIGLEAGLQEFHAAVDASGQVIALAALDVDVRCARLVFLRSVGEAPGGPARYALMHHVIGELIDRRVSLLLVAGAVRLAPGLQYFQQRLGFDVFNVRPVAAEGHATPAPAPGSSRPRGSSRSSAPWPAAR